MNKNNQLTIREFQFIGMWRSHEIAAVVPSSQIGNKRKPPATARSSGGLESRSWRRPFRDQDKSAFSTIIGLS
jgi:hypothetical protein